MSENKKYDLYDRTNNFARDCRIFIRIIPKDICNIEDSKQLARSSGSVCANYIEACESISRKDFLLRIKICRKESKESHAWLKMVYSGDKLEVKKMQTRLIQEAIELARIFGAIVIKREKSV